MVAERRSDVFAHTTGGLPSSRGVSDIIRRRWWVILLVPLLCAGVAALFSFGRSAEYEATTKLLVGQERGSKVEVANAAGTVQGLQQLTQTVAEAVKTRLIAESVIDDLGLQMDPEHLLNNISSQQVGTTQFVRVEYEDTNADRARLIANSISAEVSQRISSEDLIASPVTVSIWESAATAKQPLVPPLIRNVVLALGVGLLLGSLLALLLDSIDARWRSAREVEQVSGAPTFAVIPKARKGR